MSDNQIRPMTLEVFRDETAMAVLGLVFAAQQARQVHRFLWHSLLDRTSDHQFVELALVRLPSTLVFLVSVEHALRWRQFRFVPILDATDLAQEELEIISLCKTSQLRGVVQPNIYQALYVRPSQKAKKLGGGCPCEADGEQPEAQGRASSPWGASSAAT